MILRDLAKCSGNLCPRRDSCQRYMNPPARDYQTWVVVEDPGSCDIHVDLYPKTEQTNQTPTHEPSKARDRDAAAGHPASPEAGS